MEDELFEDENIYCEKEKTVDEEEFFDIESFMSDQKKSGLNAISFLRKREGSYKLGYGSSGTKQNHSIFFTAETINLKVKYRQLSLF